MCLQSGEFYRLCRGKSAFERGWRESQTTFADFPKVVWAELWASRVLMRLNEGVGGSAPSGVRPGLESWFVTWELTVTPALEVVWSLNAIIHVKRGPFATNRVATSQTLAGTKWQFKKYIYQRWGEPLPSSVTQSSSIVVWLFFFPQPDLKQWLKVFNFNEGMFLGGFVIF